MKKSQNRINLFILITSLLLGSCGLSPEEKAATETKIAADIFATQTADAPTATLTPSPTPTNTRKPTPNRTATAAVKGTQEAQPMADLVQQLYDDGYLQSTQGEFSQLGVFQESFAQINWVRPYETDLFLNNFVLRTDIHWKTAKEGANIKYSGCGFYFGDDGTFENFHIVRITLNGKITLSRRLNNSRSLTTLASSYFGKIDYMQGNAELILLVEEGTIQVFVNGEHPFVRYDQMKLKGYLGYVIGSGTNAGFGTRCTFRDTEIWSLET